jgi:hypothetical protein
MYALTFVYAGRQTRNWLGCPLRPRYKPPGSDDFSDFTHAEAIPFVLRYCCYGRSADLWRRYDMTSIWRRRMDEFLEINAHPTHREQNTHEWGLSILQPTKSTSSLRQSNSGVQWSLNIYRCSQYESFIDIPLYSHVTLVCLRYRIHVLLFWSLLQV